MTTDQAATLQCFVKDAEEVLQSDDERGGRGRGGGGAALVAAGDHADLMDLLASGGRVGATGMQGMASLVACAVV